MISPWTVFQVVQRNTTVASLCWEKVPTRRRNSRKIWYGYLLVMSTFISWYEVAHTCTLNWITTEHCFFDRGVDGTTNIVHRNETEHKTLLHTYYVHYIVIRRINNNRPKLSQLILLVYRKSCWVLCFIAVNSCTQYMYVTIRDLIYGND